MLAAGADLLDLGAESTRPGSEPVPAAQEQDRLLPVLAALRRETERPLSVDTYRPETARLALEAGAEDLVTNDDGSVDITTPWEDFSAIKDSLDAAAGTPSNKGRAS